MSFFREYSAFLGRHRHWLGFGFLTVFWANLGQTFFISWFGAEIQSSLELSASAYGGIYSAATLASGITIIYFGALLDRVELKKYTSLVSLGLVAACGLLASANDVITLALAFYLVRLTGQGLFSHIGYTSMARYFDQGRGKAISVAALGMPVGEAILPAVAVFLIATFGWRQSWWLFAASVIVLYWPMMMGLLSRCDSGKNLEQIDSSANNEADIDTSKSRRQVLSDWNFWLVLPAVLSPAFLITGVFIHQAFLIEGKQWSLNLWAANFVVYGIAHLSGSLIFGPLVDKLGPHRLLRWYLWPLIFAMSVLVFVDASFGASLFMLLAGVSVGGSGPIVGSLWPNVYGAKHLGAIRSMVTACMVISTSISPFAAGLLIDQGYTVAEVMGCGLIYVLLAWCLSLLVYRQAGE